MNTEIRNILKKAKEKGIKKQCLSIENNLKNKDEVLTHFTEYCSDLYNHESNGDTTILNGPYDTNDDIYPS